MEGTALSQVPLTPPALRPIGTHGTPVAPRAQPAPEPGHYALASADRAFRAQLARFTLGISPATVADTQAHWLAHLAMSPGKQFELIERAARNLARLGLYATGLQPQS